MESINKNFNYERNAHISFNACKKCHGKCCSKEEVLVPPIEFIKIKCYLKENSQIKTKITSFGLFIILSDGNHKCQALDVDGCRIPKGERPSVCRLFPIVIEKLIPLTFSISNHCKYCNEFVNSHRDEKSDMTKSLSIVMDILVNQKISEDIIKKLMVKNE